MSISVATVKNPDQLLHDGWRVLVDKLGVQSATQFVLLLERGKGNSVNEIAAYWKSASVDDIYTRVSEWMTKSGHQFIPENTR